MQHLNIIYKIDIKSIKNLLKNNKKISKVELCIYLLEFKGVNNIKEFGINIGRNLRDFNIGTVIYSTAPEVYRERCMYIVKEEYKNRYINFDITKIINEWVAGKSNYGLTISGVNIQGFIFFSSSISDKKPYLKISYSEGIENNNIFKDEDCFNEIKNRSDNKVNNEKICIENKCHGLIINTTGKFINESKLNFIVWDKSILCKGVYINNVNRAKVLIEEIGIYQVDYCVNIRSNEFAFMEIMVNDEEIEYSRTQIGLNEHMNSGNTIININRNNSAIKLAIEKTNMILSNMGIAASLRIIKL